MGLFDIDKSKTQSLVNAALKKTATSKANGATFSEATASSAKIAKALMDKKKTKSI